MTVSLNDIGPEVIILQAALEAASFYRAAHDGRFGPLTKQAVERFQTAHNLPVTGRVDAATWAAIELISDRGSSPSQRLFANE